MDRMKTGSVSLLAGAVEENPAAPDLDAFLASIEADVEERKAVQKSLDELILSIRKSSHIHGAPVASPVRSYTW